MAAMRFDSAASHRLVLPTRYALDNSRAASCASLSNSAADFGSLMESHLLDALAAVAAEADAVRPRTALVEGKGVTALSFPVAVLVLGPGADLVGVRGVGHGLPPPGNPASRQQ